MVHLFLSFKVAAVSSVRSLLQSSVALLERQDTRSYRDAVFSLKKTPTQSLCSHFLKTVRAARTEQVTDSSGFLIHKQQQRQQQRDAKLLHVEL